MNLKIWYVIYRSVKSSSYNIVKMAVLTS